MKVPAPEKAVLLTVDDDPQVLMAIERDLRRRYAERFRIIRADSGVAALGILHQLIARAAPVAMMLVDQRMPGMSGVEFLRQALQLFPDSKRVLLTAYADTDAAIAAINDTQVNHFLLKPWDPPEEQLYPVLDELLDDWQSEYRPPFTGVRVIGDRWTPSTHAVKNFLARHQIPYRWLDIETADSDPEIRRILDTLAPSDSKVNKDSISEKLPLLLFADGTKLEAPTPQSLAEKLGLRTKAQMEFYDLAIVGGGPAGLAAAVYAASEGLRTVMIEREAPGGQAAASSRIENYLGFPSGLSGGDLTRRAVAQARRFGAEILAPQEVVALSVDNTSRILKFADGTAISCHVLLVATGVQWRRLEIPGIDRLTGAGVYYGAAMTEAFSCRNETVYIIGGANSAGQAALHFAKFAREVIMLVRGPSLSATMSKYLIDRLEKTPNVRVANSSSVVEVHGDSRLEAISIHCADSGDVTRFDATSLYIFIGAEPRTEWLDGVVERDERGFIPTGPDLLLNGKPPRGWTLDREPMLLETNVPGVFVAGDVRRGSVKRVASGVGEGAIAVQFIHQYLAKL